MKHWIELRRVVLAPRCLARLVGLATAIALFPAGSAAGAGGQDVSAAEATLLKVLKSPRCLNCHPTDDVPRQGDEMRLHGVAVERGVDDRGWEAQRCETCHREENNTYAGIPGAPHWGLAPRSMGWLGLADEELLARLLDPKRNGGRTREELVEHMSHDDLVLWAWEPGEGRKPPPVSLEDFRKALVDWLAPEAP